MERSINELSGRDLIALAALCGPGGELLADALPPAPRPMGVFAFIEARKPPMTGTELIARAAETNNRPMWGNRR